MVRPPPHIPFHVIIDGDVGIGTTDPSTKLHIVDGSFTLDNSVDANGSGQGNTHFNMITHRVNNSGLSGSFNKGWGFFARGENSEIPAEANDMGLAFYEGGVWKYIYFIEHDTGNIGIGTNQPKSALHLYGVGKIIVATNPSKTEATISTDGGIRLVMSEDAHSPEVNGYLDFSSDMDIITAYARLYYNSVSREFRLVNTHNDASLRIEGNAYKPGGGAWAASSDIRLKNVDGPYQVGLEEVLALEPILFHYKEGNARKEPINRAFVGLSAQAVQAVMPDMVSERDDGYLDFDPSALPYALINAVHELKVENDSLRHDLEKLKIIVGN